MTKNKVNILIILMAIALLGIISLQLIWMKNAMVVRNELFDRSVTEALLETSKHMETMLDVAWLRERKIFDPMSQAPPFRQQNRPPFQQNKQPFYINTDTTKKQFEHRRKLSNNIRIITATDDSTAKNIHVEIIKIDSVIASLEQKIDFDIRLLYSHAIENDSLAHTENIEKFTTRAKRLKNVAGRMVFESWMTEHPPEPDTSIIIRLLKDELQKRNIPIPFEMGVYYNDNLLIRSKNANSISLEKSKYQTSLFPGNIIDRDQQLSIYFPDRKTFVFKTLFGPSLLSLLLSAFVMGVFGLSIYYILKQKKISEMKSDFINNMTHEFKTPLATISVAADSILNKKVITDIEKIKSFTGMIKKENLRMNKQVETILQIARLDKKDYEFDFKSTNIHELIDKAVQSIILQIENRGGEIKVYKNATNPIATTDNTHTINLLNNLLDNANKYSPEAPDIKVETQNSDHGVLISVTDKGIGMNKQVQQKIFEKFYRETTGNIHNVKGFGLGLSYAKAIVEANKGKITVSSEIGKGSTFQVHIPFKIE